MIIFVRGEQGSGKTLFLSAIGKLFYETGATIYSSYHVNFPHIPVIHPTQIHTHMQNGLFLGDELWSWLDCWKHGLADNFTATAMMRVRKNQLSVIHTAQKYMQPKNRLRTSSDFYISMPKENKYNISENDMFMAEVYDYRGEMNTRPVLGQLISRVQMEASPNFNLYDTFEPIYSDMELGRLKYCLESQDFFEELKPFFIKLIQEKKKVGADVSAFED
jgi:hypothetical protein